MSVFTPNQKEFQGNIPCLREVNLERCLSILRSEAKPDAIEAQFGCRERVPVIYIKE